MPIIISPKTFEHLSGLLGGLSDRNLQQHYRLYCGYVEKFNEIHHRLYPGTVVEIQPTDLRSLKTDLSFALGGIRNHELYFQALGGRGTPPTGALSQAIIQDFGTFEAYRNDLIQSALGSRGWAWTILDLEHGHLLNLTGESNYSFPSWNTVPILAVDVYEHAFFYDFGPDKVGYLQTYLANVNWNILEQRYMALRKAVPVSC